MGVLIETPHWKTRPGGAFDGGNEPPYDAGMEARVARLENFAGAAGERLARIETKLDIIAHETSQFKWWLAGSMVVIVVTVIGTVIGTGVGIQQMTVATFQAAKEQAASTPHPIINAPSDAPKHQGTK